MAKPLLFFILIIPQIAFSKILIATVAQVKSHVITSREVAIHKSIDNVLGKRLANFSDEGPEEQVIREWLLFFEASTFYNTKVQNKKVSEYLGVAKKRLGKSGKWKKLSVSESEMKEKIRRRLEANRLYNFKKKASILPVSLAEIETEYTQNRIRYGNQSFEEVKDKIRKNKIDMNLKRRMEQWFQVLEQKYKVQRFSKFNPL